MDNNTVEGIDITMNNYCPAIESCLSIESCALQLGSAPHVPLAEHPRAIEFFANDERTSDTEKRRLDMKRDGYTPKRISEWERKNFADKLTKDKAIELKDGKRSTSAGAIRMMLLKSKKNADT